MSTLYDDALESLESEDPGGQAPPTNPFLETLDDLSSGRTREMRSAQIEANKTTPDRAAEVRDIADFHGLAPEVVERNFDDLKARTKIERRPYAEMQRDTPHLAEWASDPANAAVADDDLEQLGFLEWVVTAPQRAFAQSVHQMRAASLQTQRLYRELTQEERDLLNSEQYAAKAGGELGSRGSWFRGAVTGGSQLLANVLYGTASAAPTAAIGAAAGATVGGIAAGPAGVLPGAKFGATFGAAAGGAMFGFELEAGLALEEFEEWKDPVSGQKLDPEVARAAAFMAGGLNAGLETLQLGILAKTIPGVKQLVGKTGRAAVREALKNPTVRAGLKEAIKSYAGTLTAETATEVAQRAITIAAGELGKYAQGLETKFESEDGVKDVISDLAREGAGALQGFAFLAVPGPTLSLAADARRVERSKQAEAFFTALGQGVSQSKTIERMPAAAEAFLARATKDGPVETLYAPVATFTQYWQEQGLDPAQVAAELTGDEQALERAQRTGEDLAIPTASYAVRMAGTDHHKFFSQELRLNPDDMNAREVVAFKAALKAQKEADAEGVADVDQAAVVRQAVVDQLVQSGIPENTAGSYADLYQSTFGSLAERAGVDPLELYRQYGLKVERTTAGGKPVVPQPSDTGGTPAATAGDQGAPPAGPGGPQEAAAAPADAEPVDAAGRSLGGYAGPERRQAEGGAPGGVERRAQRSQDQPIGSGGVGVVGQSPTAADDARSRAAVMSAVTAMRAENPNIDQEAAAAAARARAFGRPGKVDEPRGRAQTGAADGSADSQTGEGLRDAGTEQPAAGGVGNVEGPGDGTGAQPRRLPTAAELPSVFERAQPDADRARLSTATQDAIRWLAEELETFPFVERTWEWLDASDKNTGNAAGGKANIIAGQAGAEVYHDVLAFAPVPILKAGKNKGQPARSVKATRGMVATAARQLLENPVIDTPVKEGIVRVAERRAAGDWSELSPAWLPPSAGEVATPEMLEALSEAIDLAMDPIANLLTDETSITDDAIELAGVGDTSFDVETLDPQLARRLEPIDAQVDILSTGEGQVRLPGEVGQVRDQEIATPEIDAPFALERETLEEPGAQQTELFQGPPLKDPPGYAAIARHLTPEEKEKRKSDYKRRLVDVFKQLPSDEDFVAIAKAGEAARGWYERSMIALSLVFGEVETPRFVGLLASLSPRVEVYQNLQNAVRVWVTWQNEGRPQGREEILDIVRRSVAGKGEAKSVLESWKNNVVEALTHPDPTNLVLSGPKVNSFARNLLGHMQEVTNDAWMATWAGIEQTLFKGGRNLAKTDPGKVPGYLAMTAKIRRAAEILSKRTGSDWTPAQVQETIWSWAKTLYELSSDTQQSAVQLLKSGQLTDQVIATAPDFAGLLTTNADLRTIFEGAGYGEELAAVETAFGLRGGPGRAARPGLRDQGTARGGPRRKNRGPSREELRSARRLDRVRRQRQEAGAGGGVTEYDQAAYHGSPHEFDRFSLNALGTGEGAQAWGWGLYFAGNREVADWYRDKLSQHKDSTVAGGGRLPQHIVQAIGAFPLSGTTSSTMDPVELPTLEKHRYRIQSQIQFYEERLAEDKIRGSMQDVLDDLASLKEQLLGLDNAAKGAVISAPGRTYTVEIPNDDDFLSWDVTASRQSAKVQAALRQFGITWTPLEIPSPKQALRTFSSKRVQELARQDIGTRDELRHGLFLAQQAAIHVEGSSSQRQWEQWYQQHQGLMREKGYVDPTGEQVYEQLQRKWSEQHIDELRNISDGREMLRRMAQGASEMLRDAGLAGMRYLDGSSRSSASGSQNYVVVDDSLIDITEFDQSDELTPESLESWTEDLRTAYPDLKHFDVYLTTQGDLELATIAIARGGANAGVGTKVMSELTNLADRYQKRVLLSPAEKGFAPGDTQKTSSKSRLVKFYKRFGFVENKGRHRDFTTLKSMYREPTLPLAAIEQPQLALENDAYTKRDIFGNRTGFDPTMQRDEVQGTFATRTKLTSQLQQQLGAKVVKTADDAARALQHLSRSAVERFDGLVVDKAGKPLAIVGSFKGSVNQAHVPISTIAAEAFRIKDAAKIWFAHNHPSGQANLSPDDGNLAAKLRDVFKGTDIEFGGLMAVGEPMEGMRRFHVVTDSDDYLNRIEEAEEGPSVPMLDRELETIDKLTQQQLMNPEAAKATLDQYAGDEFGVLYLDTKNRPTAFVPLDPAQAETLRQGGRLDALYRSFSIANASSAVIQHRPGEQDAAINLANALTSVDVGVLDILERAPDGQRTSVRETRGQLQLSGEFKQEDKTGGKVRRGAIRFGPDRQMTIRLFEAADLSTFLHESGHFFLEIFGDLHDKLARQDPANLTPAQRQVLADYGQLLEWFGVKDRSEIAREHHEQFARGFEAYLLEGQAPSLELQSAFAKFRAWLVGIYRTMRGLQVNLNPEIRQVLDRLVATDRAIAEARAAGKVEPMFLTPEQAGMDAIDFGLYRDAIAKASRSAREELDKKLLGEVERERQQQWKDRRDEIEAEVTKEVHAQPVYQVLAAMQRGTKPDGSPLVEGQQPEPLKLSRAILVERYGKERLQRLPKPYVYARDGGLDPDAVAQSFGFSSGDELLLAIENAPKAADIIRQQTDQRMLQEQGSLLLDGTLLEEAQAALSSEDRDLVIRAELRALGQLARKVLPFQRAERAKAREQVQAEREKTALADAEVAALKRLARSGPATIRAAIPPADVVRTAAQERIARTTLRNIRPQVYWSASRKAAQKAIEAAARQDFETAIVEKNQELLNLALYREAMRARSDADARVKRAKLLGTPAGRKKLVLAGDSYTDQVDGILDRYEFAKVSQKVLDRRASLRKFVAGLEGEGQAVDIAEDVLEETRRKNYQEITYEELVGVSDALDHIVHLAQLKDRLLKNEEQRELARVTGELSESIRDNAKGKAREGSRDRRPSEERRRMIGDFFAGHRKLASLLRELDGFKDGGPAWRYIMLALNQAADREATMVADATRQFAGIVEKAFPGRAKRTLYDRQHVPQIGRSMSRMERIVVALNWGNEGNRDRIRQGEKWDDQQVQAILDTLSSSDLVFVQEVFDFVNSYWSEIEAKQKRVYGVAPSKVEAVPFTAAAGSVRGGYYPLKYDDRRSAKAIQNLDLETAQAARQAAYTHATTKRGHTKERVENVKIPVRLDFGTMFEHVGQVVHDLTHHEALIDVGRILGSSDVQQAILETQGDLVYKQIRNAIRDVAFGDVPAQGGFERAINHIRVGATVAGLGWNVVTSLLQPLGLANSVVRIGPRWVAKGVGRWLRNAVTMQETVHWIEEQSEFMRNRGRTQQREISEIRNSISIENGKVRGFLDDALHYGSLGLVDQQAVADSYFWFIQQAQRLVDVPTWLGAYEKAMAGGHPEALAIAMADQAVLDSQGGGQIKDLAEHQRGTPMKKLWTNFYSYFNVVYNQAVEAKRARRLTNPLDVGRLAGDYLMLFIVPATLGFAIREVMRPRGDDDETAEELAARIFYENVSYLTGTMLGLREVSGAIAGAYGYEGPAGARFFSALSRLGMQVKQGEIDQALWKAANDVAGTLFHYPAGQIQRTLTGILALIEGKTENPAAVVAGPSRAQ